VGRVLSPQGAAAEHQQETDRGGAEAEGDHLRSFFLWPLARSDQRCTVNFSALLMLAHPTTTSRVTLRRRTMSIAVAVGGSHKE